MDKVGSITNRDLLPEQSHGDEKDLSKSFKAAADKPHEHRLPLDNYMVAPPPLPPPPQAPPPPPPSSSGPSPDNVLQAAQYLSDNWGNWGMHDGVSFSNPPSDASSQEKNTLAYFANPVLANSIVVDAGGKAGDPLSKAALDQFISDAEGDEQAAGDALAHTPSSAQSNGTIQDLTSIVENWHAWGLHSGITPFSNPPPSDLPPDAKAALGAITSNPYLLSQIGNHTGSGAITRDEVASFLNLAAKNPVLLDQTPSTDTHVQDWLDSLGGAVSDQDKSALGQTGNDAQTLLDFFNSYPNNASELNTEEPPDVQDAENRLLGVDAIKKQLYDSTGHVTRYTVGAFLGNLDKAADSAKSSWDTYTKANPNPDPIAKQIAAQASILQGDAPILDDASAGGQVDGKIDIQDLQAAGSSGDAGLPSALRSAASLFTNPGQFTNLEQAGLKPGDLGDGLADNDSFDSYLQYDVPKNRNDAVLTLQSDAIQQAVQAAGGDASKVTPDYFKTGKSDASAADKVAAMIQLSQSIGQLKGGAPFYQQEIYGGAENTENSSPAQWHEQYPDQPTPGQQQQNFLKGVQADVTKIAEDPDVQQFLAAKLPDALKNVVAGNPSMKAAVQQDYQDSSSTAALEDAFNGSTGAPADTTKRLNAFAQTPTVLAEALGIKPDLTKTYDDAPKNIQQDIQKGWNYVTSGQEIKDLQAQGKSSQVALLQSNADLIPYTLVLNPKDVFLTAGINKYGNVVSNVTIADLTASASAETMLSGLGVKDVHDPALLKYVQQHMTEIDPGGGHTATQIVQAMQQITLQMHFGLKFQDAVTKAGAADVYKKGVTNIAAGVMLGGLLIAKGAQGQGNTELDTQAALQAGGLLMEGGAKYYRAVLKKQGGLKDQIKGWQNEQHQLTSNLPPDASAQLRQQVQDKVKQLQGQIDQADFTLNHKLNIAETFKNGGKFLAGAGGGAAGLVLGIQQGNQALADGDKLTAGFDYAQAGLDGLQGISATGEVGAYVIPRVTGSLAGETGGEIGGEVGGEVAGELAGSIFGAVTAGAGTLAIAGTLIYGIVEAVRQEKQEENDANAWYETLQNGFSITGLPLPSQYILESPANGWQPNLNPTAGGPGGAPPKQNGNGG